MKWKTIQLEEISRDFISGGTPDTKTPEFWSGTIPWITGADVVDRKVVIGRRFISKSAVEESATNIVPKGAILLVTRTGVGKIAIAPEDIAISQDLTGIVLKDGFVPHFAMWAIYSQIGSLQAVQRGATIKGVLRKDVERLPIPFTGESEQRRIVELLEQADVLRRQRVEADQLADNILPALFHKMFGDPATNPNGWPTDNLLKICSPKQWPTISSKEILETGYPVYGANGKIGFYDSYNHEFPTVLITCRGATCGTINVCEPKCYVTGNAMSLDDPDKNKISVEFLECYLRVRSLRDTITGAAQPQITRTNLGIVTVFTPPKPLVDKFSALRRNIGTLAENMQKASDEIQKLFATMLHRAFTGELTAKWREAHLKELLAEMEQQARLLRTTSENN